MVRKTGSQNFVRTKILTNGIFQEPNLFFENFKASLGWKKIVGLELELLPEESLRMD